MIHSLQPNFLTTLKTYIQLENKKNYFPTSRRLSLHPAHIQMKNVKGMKRKEKTNKWKKPPQTWSANQQRGQQKEKKEKKQKREQQQNHQTINCGTRTCDLGL